MGKLTLEQWYQVRNDGLKRRELLRSVSFLDLRDLLSESISGYETATDDLKAARQAFIDDCQQRDQAINQERANLQKEVSDQENKIRSLSAQYQKALGSGKVSLIPDLKKQIAAATAARDEAHSTLAALDGVKVEYNEKLFAAAESAIEPVKAAKQQLNDIRHEIFEMREILEHIFDYDSEELREIRNAGYNLDLSKYDPQHWSNWSEKISGIQKPVSSAACDPEPMRPI